MENNELINKINYKTLCNFILQYQEGIKTCEYNMFLLMQREKM